jgi:hypothetical protein
MKKNNERVSSKRSSLNAALDQFPRYLNSREIKTHRTITP